MRHHQTQATLDQYQADRRAVALGGLIAASHSPAHARMALDIIDDVDRHPEDEMLQRAANAARPTLRMPLRVNGRMIMAECQAGLNRIYTELLSQL